MILFTFGVLIAVVGLAAGVICGFLELLSIPILIVYFLYVVAAEIVSKIKQKRETEKKDVKNCAAPAIKLKTGNLSENKIKSENLSGNNLYVYDLSKGEETTISDDE